jgi:hypothetical protein
VLDEEELLVEVFVVELLAFMVVDGLLDAHEATITAASVDMMNFAKLFIIIISIP